MRLLLHILGIDDVSSRWYALWSGIGGELSVLATPMVLARRHNCHIKWCWRLGKHPMPDPVTGTALLVCRKHHLDEHPTAASVRDAAGQQGAKP